MSELELLNSPKSKISENIRTIRTNLLFSSDKNKVLLVTSSVPGDGKSFISSNLAISFTQIGEKVLIIDADLRLGRIHKIFDINCNNGLSNLLSKGDDEINYIYKTKINNLDILPRGIVPPNPSELLNNEYAPKILENLKKKYDRIIIDGVPVIGLSDALIMGKFVDGCILVTSLNYTKIDDLVASQKALLNIGARICGVIVNRCKSDKNKYYNNYLK